MGIELAASLLTQASPPATLRSDEVLSLILLDIAVILVAARLLGALARRVGQPTVVGEIVAGVLLGPTLLGRTVFAWDRPWGWLDCGRALAASPGSEPSITACLFPPQARSVIGVIGQVALVLFMFLVGLEVQWGNLRGKGRSIATVAVGVVGLPMALGFVVGPMLYDAKWVGGFGTPTQPSRLAFNLFVGAMLAVTAFPVMARILQEKGLTTSAMGSVGIASAALVTVLMFLAVSMASSVATGQSAAGIGIRFGLVVVYVAALFLVVRPALAPLGRAYETDGLTAEVFAVILILLFASAWIAHELGINVIVGSFLLGAVLPAREGLFRDMSARLSTLTAVVLLPIFLAFSGLNTDFTTLGAAFLGGIAVFLVAGVAGKWAGGVVFARLGGLSWAEGNVIGILMNCRGLLVLVVALIGYTQGVISPQLQVAGVVSALVTTMMTGPLFDRFLSRVPVTPAVVGGDTVRADPVVHPAG